MGSNCNKDSEETITWCAEVVDNWKTFEWTDQEFKGAETLYIYEAHVGMAQEEGKVGSYREFADYILPRVKKSGYNTIQLMAIMEHPYYGSFGYQVSSFFAASSWFGKPEDLKYLVNKAHKLGIRVLLDVVHSHAVKNTAEGINMFDGTTWQFFHDGEKGDHPTWGTKCFNYGKDEVIHFLLSNLKFWLEEYHFDGFRFDGVTSMLFFDHGLGTVFSSYDDYFNGSVDDDAWVYLSLANRIIHDMNPNAITIAEDVSGMPGVASPIGDFGIGFDYRMAMGVPDFWFKLVSEVRDEDWPMGGIYRELTNKRREERVVSYVESHDQALVGGKSFFFQLVDKDVYFGMRRDQENLNVERGIAIHKMARLSTAALNGGAYLNFMGNEFGHPEWIDFPRAENGWSYRHARRQWSLGENRDLRFKALGDFDVELMRLIGSFGRDLVMPVKLKADESDKVLAFMRSDKIFVFNFHPSKSYVGYGVQVPPNSLWQHLLDTDECRFGGQGRIAGGKIYATEQVYDAGRNEMLLQVKLYLPARTALVLRRI